MLRDPRLLHIAESSIEGGFTYTDIEGTATKFCGLLKILSDVCYSDYDFKDALKRAPIAKRFKLKTGLRRPWQGQRRGKLVHDQVRAIVNGGDVARDAMFGTQRSENADHIIASLQTKNLRPLVAEYIVYDEALRLASPIDIVCVTTKKTGSKLCLIEVKNWSNGFTHANGHLQNPPSLRHLNNCALHQAFLQLAFYRRLVEIQHPLLEIGACYVVQETQTYTKYYRLPDEFVKASAELLACVAEYRHRQLFFRMVS
jgi:hypothetical protein